MPDVALPATLAGDFLQFHVLTAFPPHNVNRDEDGRPKTCEVGGALRGRISSQAKKRALRFAPHFPQAQRATRTREAGIQVFRDLTAAGIDPVSAAWAALAVNFAIGAGGDPPTLDKAEALAAGDGKARGKKAAKTDGDAAPSSEAQRAALEKQLGTDQGLVVSTREFTRIQNGVAVLTAAWAEDPAGFPAVLEGWVKRVCKEKLLTQDDIDLDTALFGRMVAADPSFNVEAACAVSHAFTTHSFTLEGDYFSAGEELNVLGGTGAAITGYGFYGGGVYYQHAVLDRAHLLVNLSQGRSAADADRLRQAAIASFLDGLLIAQPRGKRNGFASDVVASYVLVTRGADPAINLSLAFLDPVKPTRRHGDGPSGREQTDLLTLSIDRLRDFHAALTTSYGLTNRVCIFNGYPPARGGANAPKDPEVATLDDLRRWVLAP